MPTTIATFIQCFVLAVLGDRLLKRYTQNFSFCERIAFACGLGLGLFSFAILAVGLMGRIKLGVLIIEAIIIILFVFSIKPVWKARRNEWRKFERLKLTPEGILGASMLLIFGVVTFTAMLTPVNSSEWDSVAYHLAVPKLYLNADKIFYIPYIHHSNFPSGMEMLYTFGLMLDSQTAAKAFHWLYGCLAIMAAGGFSARYGGKSAGWIAVCAVVSTPLVMWEAGTAYIDIGSALYCMLCLISAYEGIKNKDNKMIVLAGFMGGLAVCIKTTALLFVASAALALLVWEFRYFAKKAFSWSVVLMLVSIVIAAPWFLRSYIYTGNPVYPFFNNIFSSPNWSDENARQYREEQLSFGVGDTVEERRSMKAFLALPWNLAAYAPDLSLPPKPNIGFTNAGTPSALFGGVLVAFVLLTAIMRLPSPVKYILLTCAFMTAGWFLMSQQSRYLMMLIPALASMGGMIAGHERRWVKVLMVSIIIIQSALVFALGVAIAKHQAQALLASRTADEYLIIAGDRSLSAVNDAVNSLPADAKVLLIDEVRGYYLNREYIWGNPGHHRLIPYEQFDKPEALIRHLKQMGITHVLFNIVWGSGVEGEKWRTLFKDAADAGMMNVYTMNDILLLYKLN